MTAVIGMAAAAPLLIGCSDTSAGGGGAGASTITPADLEAALDAAQQKLDEQKYADAELILTKLVDKAPNSVAGHEMLARVLHGQSVKARQGGLIGQAELLMERAAGQYAAAVGANPDNPDLWHSCGLFRQAAGDADGALDAFLTAHQLDRANPKYPLFAAQIRLQHGELDDAEKLLQHVITIDADQHMAHASLAIVALQRERFAEALEHIEEARDIDPMNLGLRVQEARIYRRSGRPLDAINLLASLDAATRSQLAVGQELAAAYDESDRPKEAAAMWTATYHANAAERGAWSIAIAAAKSFLAAGNRQQALLWVDLARLHADADLQVVMETEQLIRSSRDRQPD